MNRADELTNRLLDDTLTDAEAVELEALLAADPAAKSRHLAAVRVELALRGLRTEFAIAGPTVAKIEADRVGRTTAAVMAELTRRPIPGRTARRSRLWVALAALAAGVLVSAWLGPRVLRTHRGGGDPPPAAPEFARLTTVSGSVEVLGGADIVSGRPNQPLTRDQTLRVVGEESVAELEFPDHTRVEVYPDSVVRFAADPDEWTRKLVLVEGRVTAVATGRVMIVAGATVVEASHGSFSVCSAGSGAARVEPTEGDVRVHRGVPAEPMVLGPGRAAFVPDDPALVPINSLWQIDSEPRDRLHFAALDVGFAPDGEVWAVSAKQWTRWKPGTPDPGRTPFLPKVFNDGLAARLTPDRRAVAVCRVDDREDGISVRELPSGVARGRVPVRVSEPRFLCVAPDASWIATALGSKPNYRRVCLWDVDTGAERAALDFDNSVTCFAVSPDGRRLAIGVSDLARNRGGNMVAVIDPHDGRRVFDLPTRRKGVYALAFSADGRQLAAGFNGVIQLWDVQSQTLGRTLEGFERVVTRLVFSPNDDLLAAGTQDGQVWVWATATGRRTRVIETGFRGVRSLAFSPDGRLLVTATSKAPVAVWEVAPEPVQVPKLES